MANEHDGQQRKFLALYVGVIVDNVDPKRLGRVRIRIPGVCDDRSAFARPLGWPGAGGKRRGTFDVPPIGAEVGVLFEQGDVNRPCYLAGYPGQDEVPVEVETPADAPKVKVQETDRWRIVIDERAGKEQLQIRDKLTDDVVEIDGVRKGVRIKGSSMVVIQSDGVINIDGLTVQLAGRLVVPNGKPIN